MEVKEIFDKAGAYAKENYTCVKVGVGAAFVDMDNNVYYTCNRSEEHDCRKHNECYKAKVTGIYESCEETRKYCKAIHAEINMINLLKEKNANPRYGILYVTRYPCVNCAHKVVEAGFKVVNYCGKQEISEEVKKIFEDAGVIVTWYPDFDYEF